MTDKAATNPVATTPLAEDASTDVHARTLGKLAGRRISLVEDRLHLPNTTQGRALAALLTGQPSSKSQNGTLVVDCHALSDVAGLITLLTSISLAIQEKGDGPAQMSPTLQQLLDFGLDRKIAVQLAADPWVTIERVSAWTSYLDYNAESFTRGGGVRGMLMSRLRDHIEAPYNPSPQQPDLEKQIESQDWHDLSDDYDYRLLPRAELTQLIEPVEPSGRSPATIWQTTYGELQLQMPRETFDTWLRPSRLIDYDPDTITYTVGVQNTYAQQWLEYRLRNMIKRTLSQVAGCMVELHFVVLSGAEETTDI